MKHRRFSPIVGAALSAVLAMNAHAQLTWDPNMSAGVTPGGTGIWDTTTGNWWDGAIDTTWDNSGTKTAIIPDTGFPEIISIDAGLVVGDLTKTTTEILEFDGFGGDQVMTIKSGGATWDTGGGAIEFPTSENAATLNMTSGDTLTVNGGGGFDAGQTPTTAWGVSGATLDYTGPTGQVRANTSTIGQFATVRIAASSEPSDATRFFHEGPNGQAYANNWELTGTDQVAFDATGNLSYTLNGNISGSGGMRTEFMGKRIVTLNGDNSAWSGGLEVGNASKVAVSDAVELGSGNVTLSGNDLANAGVLLLAGVDMGSSRELHVNGFGGSIVNQGINSFGGKITGSGILHIGHANHDNNTNRFIVSGTNSDHTGTTRIWRGTLELGAGDALSNDTVLEIGGEGTGIFQMSGFDAEIAGLTTSNNNTRRIDNDGESISTLTINVPDGASYNYESNFAGAMSTNLVKAGPGTQSFIRNGGFTTIPESISVSDGLMVWNILDGAVPTATATGGTLQLGGVQSPTPIGDVAVNSAASLVFDGNVNATTVTAASGSTSSLNWKVTDWAGVAGTGWTQLAVTGELAVNSGAASFTVVIDDANLEGFAESTNSFAIATAGTLTAAATDFAIDDSMFTLGTGSWSVDVVGNDVVLTYTATTTPYDSWASDNGLTPPDAGKEEDKEKDGIDNVLEWVLGGDPLVSDTGILPTTENNGTNLIFTFDRADSTIGEVTLTVQYGSDLLGWTDEVVPLATIGIFTITDNGDTDTIVATIPVGSATKQFARLKGE